LNSLVALAHEKISLSLDLHLVLNPSGCIQEFLGNGCGSVWANEWSMWCIAVVQRFFCFDCNIVCLDKQRALYIYNMTSCLSYLTLVGFYSLVSSSILLVRSDQIRSDQIRSVSWTWGGWGKSVNLQLPLVVFVYASSRTGRPHSLAENSG